MSLAGPPLCGQHARQRGDYTMRTTLVLMLVGMGVASPASAQVAEFRCPDKGNEYEYRNPTDRVGTPSRKMTSLGRIGDSCAFEWMVNGSNKTREWLWGFVFAIQSEPELAPFYRRLWPLRVGRTSNLTLDMLELTRKKYPAAVLDPDGSPKKGDDGKPLYWRAHHTGTVASFINVKTPHGSFDSFRIELRVRTESNQHEVLGVNCQDSTTGKATFCYTSDDYVKLWYAPALSAIIKYEVKQFGFLSAGELVSAQ